ncbi:MAG: MarR family transcriptional regulator [Clostridiaceae bacterium]|nr:MarR family transcriptional regulator [Clostridiales bacterium]NLV62869.1 MarR family transcriptional regulator [Clostridiaceae bacterium]
MVTKTYGGFLLSRVRHLSGRVFEKLLKESGVDIFNGAQGRILYVLWEHGQLTITEISRLTSLAKTTLTSMLDRMETGGLIERIPDKRNRRQILVSVTEKAKGYREKYDLISDKMNEIFYDGFTDDEIISFENHLRRIIKNLEKEGV